MRTLSLNPFYFRLKAPGPHNPRQIPRRKREKSKSNKRFHTFELESCHGKRKKQTVFWWHGQNMVYILTWKAERRMKIYEKRFIKWVVKATRPWQYYVGKQVKYSAFENNRQTWDRSTIYIHTVLSSNLQQCFISKQYWVYHSNHSRSESENKTAISVAQ